MAKIPMTILKPQNFHGVPVQTGDRIETEDRKVAAVLTKLGRAREIEEPVVVVQLKWTEDDIARINQIPDLDLSEPFNLPDKVEVAIGMDLASKDDHVEIAIVPAKRAYKKRAYKRRGPAVRK